MNNFNIKFAALLFLFSFTSQVWACSCAPFDAQKNFSDALIVFEGFVTKAEIIEWKDGLWSKYKNPLVIGDFKVIKSWKGEPKKLDGLVTDSEEAACGLTFSVARSYIFYIYKIVDDKGVFNSKKYGQVSLCGNLGGKDYQLYESTRKWLESK